ncbi:MAG: GNAT family N-acetyltransferase [Clostridium sp.]
MNIIYKESISVEDYNMLREAVGWGKLCDEQAQQGLDHSAYIISCYDNDKIVGTARIIWDKGYISYLSDVMVIPEYQGMGIGFHLVKMTIDFMKSQIKEGWKIKIVLTASKGKEAFYRKLGFNERPNKDAGAGMDLWLI